MSRVRPVELVIAAALLGACDKTPGTNPVPAESAAPAAPAGGEAGADGSAEPAEVDPASLVGQFGFDSRTRKKVRCKKVDQKMLKLLAAKHAQCRRRPPSEAPVEGAGEWTSCQWGKSERVFFDTRATCKDQLAKMGARGH